MVPECNQLSIPTGKVLFFSKAIALFVWLFVIFPQPTLGFPQLKIFPKTSTDADPRKFLLGRLQLHPGYAIESKYDSNVFLQADKVFADGTSEGREDDFIFINRPSMGLELERLPGEVFGFNLNYQAEDERFVNLGDTQDALNHQATGSLNFGGPGGKTDLTLMGKYDKSRSTPNFDLQTNIGSRTKFESFTGLIDFVYIPSRISRFEAGLDFTGWRFGEPNQTIDSDLYSFHGAYYWQHNPLMSYGVSYKHTQKTYISNSTTLDDSYNDEVLLGVQRTSSLIKGELFLGLVSKRFERLSNENAEELRYILNLIYQPTSQTKLSLNGSRGIHDSTFKGIQFYVYNKFGLTISQKIGNKIEADLKGVYENLKFQSTALDVQGGGIIKTREDKRMEFSLSLIYEIQAWLEAKAKYSYIQNDSNFDSIDFKRNVGLLELAIIY